MLTTTDLYSLATMLSQKATDTQCLVVACQPQMADFEKWSGLSIPFVLRSCPSQFVFVELRTWRRTRPHTYQPHLNVIRNTPEGESILLTSLNTCTNRTNSPLFILTLPLLLTTVKTQPTCSGYSRYCTDTLQMTASKVASPNGSTGSAFRFCT